MSLNGCTNKKSSNLKELVFSCLLRHCISIFTKRKEKKKSFWNTEEKSKQPGFYDLTYSLLNLPGKENWTDKRSPAYYLQR